MNRTTSTAHRVAFRRGVVFGWKIIIQATPAGGRKNNPKRVNPTGQMLGHINAGTMGRHLGAGQAYRKVEDIRGSVIGKKPREDNRDNKVANLGLRGNDKDTTTTQDGDTRQGF